MMKLIAVALVVFSQFPSDDAFKIKPRIVNGRTATETQFPYYVFLKFDSGNPNYPKVACGGALLNDEFVVTAAHCTDRINVTAVDVHFGANVRRPHHLIRVEKDNIFKYPGYVLVQDDIALIRLPNKVEFTPNIQPVRLPTTCEIADNTVVVIMGNGKMGDARLSSSHLRYAHSKTISFETCRNTYPAMLGYKPFICTLDQENTGPSASSVCRGDSGSPLVKVDGTLIGVASYGKGGLCEAGHPQIFTRVSHYTKWINHMTGLNLLEC